VKVIRDREAGFCPGVRRAVGLARREAGRAASVYTLGPLIHNRLVVEELAEQRVRSVYGTAAIESGAVAIVRSHGAPPGVITELAARGVRVVDATCPLVRKVQVAAWRLAQLGWTVIVAGDSAHPEVQGIIGWCRGRAELVESAVEVDRLPRRARRAVVAQTTFRRRDFSAIVDRLRQITDELRVEDTICGATERRQRAIQSLGHNCDVLLVVGGRDSSNTMKLVQAGREAGAKTYLVTHPEEIRPGWFASCNSVGITAGSSTPEQVIDQVARQVLAYCGQAAPVKGAMAEEN